MALLYLLKTKMAGKLVILALALSICKVQSQSIGCCSPTSNINGIKASPQLQVTPGQSCNLQAIPLSQFLSQVQASQGANLQKTQTPVSVPKQSIVVSSVPQVSSPRAQCSQPSNIPNIQSQSLNTQVISAPVSTITIPPTTTTTIIDNSLSNSLANALQMLIANDFINSAISNNIINNNQDCVSVPVIETSVPTCDLSSFINNLNANQLNGECQTIVEPEQPKDCYDWEKLLSYLNDDKKVITVIQPEPENKVDAFFKYLKEKGLTAAADPIVKPVEVQTYTPSVSSLGDVDDSILQAITAYFGGNYDTCSKNGNVAEIVFPEEIPAQLICNYGYMPTTVPVVSFSVQPVDPNYSIVGSQAY